MAENRIYAMYKLPVSIMTSLVFVTAAHSHTGHLADLAGHDHWVAGAAIGVAIALGIWGALKGGGSEGTNQAEDGDTEENPA